MKKTSVIPEEKNKNLWNKWHFVWGGDTYYAAHLKNYFYGSRPTVFRMFT